MPQDATLATRALDRCKAAFDPDWYVAHYDDVAPAIANGRAADAWAHYVSIGRAARARIAHELSREHHLAAIAAHLQRADSQHPVALNSR